MNRKQPEANSRSDSAISPPRVLHALCVEDVPEDAELYLRVLKEAGYQVVADVVSTREEFARKLGSTSYDVVLSDYRMPGWTGTDALEVLKRSENDTPFLLITGTIGEEAAAECIKQGAADYILKDRPARLPSAVRRAMEEKAARDDRARMEEALKLFRLLVDHSNDAIQVVDPDNMRLLDVNASGCQMLGYTRDELLSMRVNDIDPTLDDSVRARHDGTLQTSGFAVFQTLQRRKDGSTFPAEVSMRFVHLDRNYVVCAVRDITERKQAEKRMVEALHFTKTILDTSPLGIIVYKASGEAVVANPVSAQLIGCSIQQISAQNFRHLESWKRSGLLPLADKALATGFDCHCEVRMTTTYGKEMWVNAYFAPFVFGDELHLWTMFEDISERKKTEAALGQAEEKYRRIFEEAVVGIYQTSPDGRILNANPAMAKLFGYDSPAELMTPRADVAHQGYVDPTVRELFKRQLEKNHSVRNFEYQAYRKDGSKIWVQENARTVHDSNGVMLYYEGTAADITERKVAEERVQYLAYYDVLTGLPNRTLLQDRLTQALASARRSEDKVALLFLDLDRFKDINDAFGHSLGDVILQEVAKRIQRCAREQDTVCRPDVSRLNGDEFLIMLVGVKDISDAAVTAKRFLNTMTAPFAVQGHSLSITCSLGISIFPDHGTDGETLIKNADAAMHSAKDHGRNNFQFFTENMNAQILERLTLEHSLRMAIDRNELFLVYQPQMDIGTRRIIGLEALLRWQHPELGLVPPDKFIGIAEHSGLILPIGEWVLRTACTQARKWQDDKLLAVPVAVNVSAVQFRQEGFSKLIDAVLQEAGLASQYLELEMTESLLLSSADTTFSVLQDLKTMGLKLAIDDFGTGYSSLSYLKRFPINKLKIDRSFIRDVAIDPDDAAITTAIIGIAKHLKLKVIAEGVEDEAQLSFLREHLCDEIQGYYFCKPLTVDRASDFMRDAVRDREA